MDIIIRGKTRGIGKTRSEQEENLRKEWGGALNDEQLDKLKFAEKKAEDKTGSTQNFIGQENIGKVK